MDVACIITSYNNARWLRRCVESVLGQTRAVDQIIVADDASSDGSQEIIRWFSREYKDLVTPILREQNVGVAENRDLAIRAARTALFTTLDGDDIFYPEKIERELDALAGKAAHAAIAFSSVARITTEEHIFDHLDSLTLTDKPTSQLVEDFLFRRGALPHNMMLSKELYIQSGGFRHHMKMYEDFDLKLRLARDAERWLFTGYVGLGYRHHNQGLSSASRLAHTFWMLRAVWENRSWLIQICGRTELYKAYAHFLVGQHVERLRKKMARSLA